MSAKMPAATTMGAETVIPEPSRKIRNAGKFGAKAQAMVKMVKKKKGTSDIQKRPTYSLIGAYSNGPC